MNYENNEQKIESVYSQRVRAGKRRTYFLDVRVTRSNDYFLTITESRKRFDDNGYDRHKIFLYKEDFNKFSKALTEVIDYVKTELMPNFDFDAFNHDNYEENGTANVAVNEATVAAITKEPADIITEEVMATPEVVDHSTQVVDKW